MASTPVQPREAIPLPEAAATDKVKRVRLTLFNSFFTVDQVVLSRTVASPIAPAVFKSRVLATLDTLVAEVLEASLV